MHGTGLKPRVGLRGKDKGNSAATTNKHGYGNRFSEVRRLGSGDSTGCRHEECPYARVYERGGLQEDDRDEKGDFLQPEQAEAVDEGRDIGQLPESCFHKK